MSPYAWFKWACEAPCPSPAAKALLFALVRHANAEGESFASQTTLARYASTSDRTVRANLDRLVALGAISVDDRPGRSTIYTLNANYMPTPEDASATPEGASALPEGDSARKEIPVPRKELPPTLEGDSGTPEGASYEVSTEGTKEDSTQENTAPAVADAEAEREERKGKDAVADAWQEVVRLWTPWQPGCARLTMTAGLGKDLRAAIRRDGPEATVRRFGWASDTSIPVSDKARGGERAAFLRERGDIKTLLRPANASSYDVWAAEWAASGGVVVAEANPEAEAAWRDLCQAEDVRQTGWNVGDPVADLPQHSAMRRAGQSPALLVHRHTAREDLDAAWAEHVRRLRAIEAAWADAGKPRDRLWLWFQTTRRNRDTEGQVRAAFLAAYTAEMAS